MPVDAAYTPEPAFAALGPEFSDPVAAADFPQLAARFWNARAAATVGLAGLTEEERAAHFGRFAPLPGQPGPRAMRYHGHQFRTYNPELGDGRGFLAAQLRAGDGRLLDLATKGSGVTPWSRSGDGRLTLKGGVREVLAASMLEALGVPTSRAFALYETGEALQRGDEPSPTRSAVLTRLSWSHVRFGTFQRLAYFDRADLMSGLIDHVVRLYYPELDGLDGPAARAPALLEAVAARAARTTAGWMAAGFVHGVLNTDNMNITGESFDYGPWRFLPRSDPEFTAAYFDHSRLYAFGRQPHAVFWNLQQLAATLTLVEPDRDALVAALNTFAPAYRAATAAAMLDRLGVGPAAGREADERFADAAFAALAGRGGGRRRAAVGAVLPRLAGRRGGGGPRPLRPARRALRRRGRARLPRAAGRAPARRLAVRRRRAGGDADRRGGGDLVGHRPPRRLGPAPRQAGAAGGAGPHARAPRLNRNPAAPRPVQRRT